MNDIPKTTPLPSIIQSIAAGFNLVANKVHLIVLPVLLDLLLLFGPRIRVYELFHDNFATAFKQIQSSLPEGYTVQFNQAYEMIQELLKQINLLGALETIPVGIPSLLAGNTPLEAPIKGLAIVEINSLLAVIMLVSFLSVIGLLFGCIYFAIMANTAAFKPQHLSLQTFMKQTGSICLLCLALIIAVCVVLIPASCALTLFSIISPLIGQIISIGIFLAAAWLIIPFFYTPHAIFISGVSFRKAVTESFRLARWSSGPTSFFIVLIVVISQGLNMIWSIPEANSWLILVGIFGHAFISSGLLASSFILFQNNKEWQSKNQQFLAWRQAVVKKPREKIKEQ